jgi:hypothetical protein
MIQWAARLGQGVPRWRRGMMRFFKSDKPAKIMGVHGFHSDIELRPISPKGNEFTNIPVRIHLRNIKMKLMICLSFSVILFCGCGTVSQLTVSGHHSKSPKDFTDTINSCRIKMKDFLATKYSLECIRDIGKSKLQNKQIKMPLGKDINLKYPCPSFLANLSSIYDEELEALISKDAALRQDYIKAVDKNEQLYNFSFSKYLKNYHSINTFYPLYLNHLKTYFTSQRFLNRNLFNFNAIREGYYQPVKDQIHIEASLSEKAKDSDLLVWNFKYYWSGQVIDQEQLYVSFKMIGSKVLVTIEESPNIGSNYPLRRNDFLQYIIRLCDSESFCRDIFLTDFYKNHFKRLEQMRTEVKTECSELEKEYDRILTEIAKFAESLKEKKNILSNLQREDLYCYLLTKNFNIFESKRDIQISKIEYEAYKEKQYCVLSLIYLNIFNNVNIKVNDQYKIARYLFDSIVRKGLREFSEALNAGDTDGIAFEIRATDRSFIHKKKDPNLSLYSFYLPEKQIFLYINDDITGKELADSSYILVDAERIHLR